ncbi:MAG: MarR family transcriptional regulator [Pseudomonadota bacterium]
MHLTPAMESFILHWGEMGAKWGVNRSVAQIHALLHLSPEPLPADAISELLGLARSNVSTGLKELQGWKLVQVERRLGDRRDHFTSIRDMFDLATTVIEDRRAREYAPTVEAVRSTVAAAKDDGTPAEIRARMEGTLETMDLFDRWYRDVQRLPRPVQKSLLKLGAGITKILPGKV